MPFFKIVIPLGPTDNRRFIQSRGRFILSSEYRNWMALAVHRVRRQISPVWTPLEATEKNQLPYVVAVKLPDRRSDAMNYDKGLRDVLTKAGVWTDDKYALCQSLPVEIDKENPSITVYLPIDAVARMEIWPSGGFFLAERGKGH